MAHRRQIPIEERIIVALDVGSEEEAWRTIEGLGPMIRFYKVGLELFLAGGFPLVEKIAAKGLRVMLDLKFFDVPNTVARAVRQLSGRGIAYATVHGDDAILKAAIQAAQDVKILAVTVLTSLDDSDLRAMGYRATVGELVLERATRARDLGCPGVVCSGLEAGRLREELGEEIVLVTPGIRPGVAADDQKRVVSAGEAILNGADHLVVGRPIREARDPRAVAASMQEEIRQALISLGRTP